MSKRKITVLVAAFLCSLLLILTGVAGANGTPTIDWKVMGGGGGVHDQVAPYTLGGTIGQAVAGTASEPGFGLCSGFWCRGAVEYQVYLPLVVRNY